MRARIAWASGLLVASAALYLPGLDRPLANGDEAIFAEMAREMVELRDPLTLRWQGEPQLLRPPASVWPLAAAALVRSPSERALRSVVALEAAVGVALLFVLGATRYGTAVGVVGAALCATADRYYVYARYIESDLLLSVLVVAAFLCWQRRWLYGWGVCLGACLLTKQIVGALPLLAPALELAARRRLERRVGFALALALALALPWHLYEWARHGGHFFEVYLVQNIVVRVQDPMHGQHTTPLYYLRMLWTREGPLVLLAALGTLYAAWRRDGMLVGWLLSALIPLSLAATRFDYYALIAYPALALAAARVSVEVVPRVGPWLGAAVVLVSILDHIVPTRREQEPWEAQMRGLSQIAGQVSRPDDLLLVVNQFAYSPRFYSQRYSIKVSLRDDADPGRPLLPGTVVPVAELPALTAARPRWFAIAPKRSLLALRPLGTVYRVAESRDYLLVSSQAGPGL